MNVELMILVRATLLLSVSALAVLVLHRYGASVRHAIWTAGLATLLVLPLTELTVPKVAIPVLPNDAVIIPEEAQAFLEQLQPPSDAPLPPVSGASGGVPAAAAASNDRAGPGANAAFEIVQRLQVMLGEQLASRDAAPAVLADDGDRLAAVGYLRDTLSQVLQWDQQRTRDVTLVELDLGTHVQQDHRITGGEAAVEFIPCNVLEALSGRHSSNPLSDV